MDAVLHQYDKSQFLWLTLPSAHSSCFGFDYSNMSPLPPKKHLKVCLETSKRSRIIRPTTAAITRSFVEVPGALPPAKNMCVRSTGGCRCEHAWTCAELLHFTVRVGRTTAGVSNSSPRESKPCRSQMFHRFSAPDSHEWVFNRLVQTWMTSWTQMLKTRGQPYEDHKDDYF